MSARPVAVTDPPSAAPAVAHHARTAGAAVAPVKGPLDGGFDERVAALAPIGLEELDAGELLTRFDRKRLVEVAALPALLASLDGDRFRVLEVAGRRVVGYRNRYFDTAGLQGYHDHLQGRRRRFKIRTRHYGDPAATMLELKLKGGRGETVKRRRERPVELAARHTAASAAGAAAEPDPGTVELAQLGPDHLDVADLDWLAAELDAAYGLVLPGPLVPVLDNGFERVTLVDPVAGERLTIDRGLTVRLHRAARAGDPATGGGAHDPATGGGAHDAAAARAGVHDPSSLLALGRRYAIVEVKSAREQGPVARAVAARGTPPVPLSKYCLGVVAAGLGGRGNPWRPALRLLQPQG